MAQDAEDFEVIVIDNASSDGSVETARESFPGIRLIRNVRNEFFARAQNQGIDVSRGDFILCLNSDCVLGRGYLREVLSAINLDPKIGMVSGKILRMDRETIDSAGLFLGRNRKPAERGYGKKDKAQYDSPGYIFGVSGACAFFRKSMLEDIKDEYGYFDETFGMYYEDLDLCWRANKKGWKAYYNPKALAYHARGGSALGRAKGRGPNFLYLPYDLKKKYVENRYKCIRKNDTLKDYLLNLPFIIAYDIKIQPFFLLSKLINKSR
jgi:GT2 family glycosyltransferase